MLALTPLKIAPDRHPQSLIGFLKPPNTCGIIKEKLKQSFPS
jgi:hypothetical protein